ncbi:MAG: hypothetical protein ABJP45_04995 [Cyclobacteriaceae bacterium]
MEETDLNPSKGKPTILCMFSGGVDSTGVLHQLMTNEKYADHPLIIHHIHIHNRENRAKAEAAAVHSILSYYKQNSIKDFLYSENVFNTMGFASLKSKRFPFDMDVCAFIAGNICAARKDILFVAMGRTKTDIDSNAGHFALRMNRAQEIFKNVVSLDMPKPPTYIFPVMDLTKKEIWDSLPEAVRSNTWWCRRPIYSDTQPAKTCGVCPTCKDVKSFANAGL